jgi:hypothetical protein
MNMTRRPLRTLLIGSVTALMVSTMPPAGAANLSEGFDTITLPGWQKLNLSSPVGTTGWFQGNPAVLVAQSGAATNSYIGANFNNTTGTNTISDWLVMPQQTTLSSNDTLSFWTRVPTTSPFPDRLEVRLSSNGSCSPGSTATGVGDFTTLLTSVNPTLAVNGYPQVWTQITTPLTGVVGDATGCLAFRYFVTSGGPTGGNSNYIGIDTVSFTDLPLDSAPVVTIGSGPTGKTANSRPPFAFAANEVATFQCRLHAVATAAPSYGPCSGPGDTHTPATALNDGTYIFEVQAVDAGSNVGTAARSFTVTAAACSNARAAVGASTKALEKAKQRLKAAKTKLHVAQQAGTQAQIAEARSHVDKAKAKVKKAKTRLQEAKHSVADNCG